MAFELWAGVLGSVILGGMLVAWWVYAMLWTEIRQRKGMPASEVPWWSLLVLSGVPIIGAACLYVALY